YGYDSTPMLFDIYALRTLYGGGSTHTGNDTYGTGGTGATDFANSQHFTIFDEGGTDTLDGSGYSSDQTISLIAGTLADMAGSNGNVGIALGAVIENAIGGSGDDTIIANSASNTFTGGSGTDVVYETDHWYELHGTTVSGGFLLASTGST